MPPHDVIKHAMNWGWAVAATLTSFAISAVGTRLVLAHLRARAILDHPNERSSHATPTPRGGGIAVLAAVLPIWLLIAVFGPDSSRNALWPIGAALILALVSWRDDMRGLSAGMRFGVHIGAVAIGLVAFVLREPIFQGVFPLWLDRLAAGFVWLWFLNLFNFMDGIDGITGGQTAALGIGAALVGLAVAAEGDALYGLTIAAAALGFLWWNWHPAKIFMGDVGSVPLGYLLGWLLLDLASRGAWAAALILPLYYLADASLTLLRRLLRGERIWQAHREHLYQRAVQGGLSHSAVVGAILLADVALIGLAFWSLPAFPYPFAAASSATFDIPWLQLALAVVVVLLLLGFLGTRQPKAMR
jgi:UDP-N-acetylmuramyl pentapeptide phosphotransferase/UDP-N-acetylglucosamine-1-phosphate transferase